MRLKQFVVDYDYDSSIFLYRTMHFSTHLFLSSVFIFVFSCFIHSFLHLQRTVHVSRSFRTTNATAMWRLWHAKDNWAFSRYYAELKPELQILALALHPIHSSHVQEKNITYSSVAAEKRGTVLSLTQHMNSSQVKFKDTGKLIQQAGHLMKKDCIVCLWIVWSTEKRWLLVAI